MPTFNLLLIEAHGQSSAAPLITQSPQSVTDSALNQMPVGFEILNYSLVSVRSEDPNFIRLSLLNHSRTEYYELIIGFYTEQNAQIMMQTLIFQLARGQVYLNVKLQELTANELLFPV